MFIIVNMFIMTGMTIKTLGANFKDFIAMLIGSIIFGIGAQPASICIQKFVFINFKDNNFSFIVGCVRTIDNFCKSIVFTMSPILYNVYKESPLFLPFAFGTLMTIIS